MFERNYQIWGDEIAIAICFWECEEEPEELTEEILSVIQDKINFIQQYHEEIVSSAISLNELATDWLAQVIEDDNVDLDDVTSVTLEDGTEIEFPVTEEAFRNSLYLVALTLEFRNTAETCKAFLEFCCEPDYFGGHRIHVVIDEQNQIRCDGI